MEDGRRRIRRTIDVLEAIYDDLDKIADSGSRLADISDMIDDIDASVRLYEENQLKNDRLKKQAAEQASRCRSPPPADDEDDDVIPSSPIVPPPALLDDRPIVATQKPQLTHVPDVDSAIDPKRAEQFLNGELQMGSLHSSIADSPPLADGPQSPLSPSSSKSSRHRIVHRSCGPNSPVNRSQGRVIDVLTLSDDDEDEIVEILSADVLRAAAVKPDDMEDEGEIVEEGEMVGEAEDITENGNIEEDDDVAAVEQPMEEVPQEMHVEEEESEIGGHILSPRTKGRQSMSDCIESVVDGGDIIAVMHDVPTVTPTKGNDAPTVDAAGTSRPPPPFTIVDGSPPVQTTVKYDHEEFGDIFDCRIMLGSPCATPIGDDEIVYSDDDDDEMSDVDDDDVGSSSPAPPSSSNDRQTGGGRRRNAPEEEQEGPGGQSGLSMSGSPKRRRIGSGSPSSNDGSTSTVDNRLPKDHEMLTEALNEPLVDEMDDRSREDQEFEDKFNDMSNDFADDQPMPLEEAVLPSKAAASSPTVAMEEAMETQAQSAMPSIRKAVNGKWTIAALPSSSDDDDSPVKQKSKPKRRAMVSSDSEEGIQKVTIKVAAETKARKRARVDDGDDSDVVALDSSSEEEAEGDTEESGEKEDEEENSGKEEEDSSDKEEEEEETSEKEEDSSSDKDVISPPKKRVTRSNKKEETKGGKKADSKRKRRRVKVSDDSDDDEEEDEDDEEDKKKKEPKKKTIRKVIDDDDLAGDTKSAQKADRDRQRRLDDKQKEYNSITIDEVASSSQDANKAAVLKEIVLERVDGEVIRVHPHISRNLYVHQAEGILFMYNAVVESVNRLDEDGVGCILAHSMGLGKTLQGIALMHTLMTHPKLRHKFRHVLLVGPKNVIAAWQNEREKWCTPRSDELRDDEEPFEELNFIRVDACYYKTPKERVEAVRKWKRKKGRSVLLMSYEMYKMLVQGDDISAKKSGKQMAAEAVKRKKPMSKMAKQKLKYTEEMRELICEGADMVICDEGHVLKNEESITNRCMQLMQTKRRVCMTGTPMQNHPDEYFTMVQFVSPNLLGSQAEFRNRFANPIKAGQAKDSSPADVRFMKKRAFILGKKLGNYMHRREWEKVFSAEPDGLPIKKDYVLNCKLATRQVELYKRYLEMEVYKNGSNDLTRRILTDSHIFNRIATHPFLLQVYKEKMDARDLKRMEKEDDDRFITSNEEEDADESTSSGDATSSSNDGNNDEEEEEDVVPVKPKVVVQRGRPGPKPRNGDGESSGRSTPENLRGDTWWEGSDLVKAEEEYDMAFSGKLAVTFEIFKMAEAIGDKLLIFSQRVETLDFIEKMLAYFARNKKEWAAKDGVAKKWGLLRGRDYDRLDGTSSSMDRERLIDRFNDPDNARLRLLLISTRAGGMGITLTAANRVIIFDVSWNPSHDLQSLFRVYRFGQPKPVYIYRLVSQGCMEERIYDRQVTKQATSLRCIDDQQVARNFSNADLGEMYRFEPATINPNAMDESNRPKGAVPKDKLLADLLLEETGGWIVRVHEHNALLAKGDDEEDLTAEEQKQAWADYEANRQSERVVGSMMDGMLTMPQGMDTQRDYQMMLQLNKMARDQVSAQDQRQTQQGQMGLVIMNTLRTVGITEDRGPMFKAGLQRLSFRLLADHDLQQLVGLASVSQGANLNEVVLGQLRNAEDLQHLFRINDFLRNLIAQPLTAQLQQRAQPTMIQHPRPTPIVGPSSSAANGGASSSSAARVLDDDDVEWL